MNEDAVRSAAKLLADAWRNMTTIEGLPPALRPGSFEEAYAIQDEMAKLIGQKTVGWKIGPASSGLLRREGFDEPGVGRLFEPNIYRSPAELPHGRITDAKLECEFALRLSADAAPRDKPYTAEELVPIVVLCPVFDVAGYRFVAPEANSQFDRVADMGGAGALVVGDEIPQWQDLDLQTLQVDLRIDGGPPVTNFEGDYRSNPLEVLVWLANFLSRRGIGLRTGDLVSTGSATHAPALYAGASAIAIFGDLGELRLTMI
jgi:2-keto-4-pentenoate hydratase